MGPIVLSGRDRDQPIQFEGEEIFRERTGFGFVVYKTARGGVVVLNEKIGAMDIFANLEEFKASGFCGGQLRRPFGSKVVVAYGGAAETLDI